jgi:hypothetical protein
MKPPRQLAFALAVLLLSAATLPAAEADAPHSVTIPAWAFDRGNARTFTEEWADAEPMVAFGGRSPVEVEYDIEFPAAGEYRVRIHYAAASPRPVALLVDGHETAQVCRAATGSWNTSRAKADEPVTLSLTAGRHTLGLHRAGDFPHIVSLRLESVSPLATPWKLHRPQARKLTDAAPGTFEHRPDPKPLRLAIEDLNATFGAKYPRGPEYLRRLAELEKAHAAEPKSETVNRALRALQREALLANPLFDFDRLLVLKRVPTAPARRAMGDSLGVGSLNAFTSDTIPRQGQFRDELAVMSNVRGEPVLKTIYAPANGETVIDPVLHFDATRLLFAQNGAKQKNWRLWEMNLDGSGRRQITPDDGADIGHFDPCHLPDGRIVFASTAVLPGTALRVRRPGDDVSFPARSENAEHPPAHLRAGQRLVSHDAAERPRDVPALGIHRPVARQLADSLPHESGWHRPARTARQRLVVSRLVLPRQTHPRRGASNHRHRRRASRHAALGPPAHHGPDSRPARRRGHRAGNSRTRKAGGADRARPAGGRRLAAVSHAGTAQREASHRRREARAGLALGRLSRRCLRQPDAHRGGRGRGTALACARCEARTAAGDPGPREAPTQTPAPFSSRT